MSFLDLVKKRVSCRRYSQEPVLEESLVRCLEAARLAPSACNSQPWRFIVIKNWDLKNKVASAAFSGIYQMNAFAKDAPVLVVVLRESSKYAAQVGGTFRGIQFSLIDEAIACEHFVLQAAEEGLGSCWIGWFNERAVKKTLNLSSKAKIDIIISLGYPLEPFSKEKIRKSLEEISEVR
ncbi:MAG TPA: nitroreductase family protein [Candidatus Omnitrophota bacterium]|nr:nitroreductase family protein [Candidatus Omnitrophota bacterium]